MLGDVLRRPMFMQAGGMTMPMPMPAQPTDNVGIMDGFAQGQPMENPIDQAKDYAGLMNLIRGNEASVEDRREELSQIVGRTDAMKTPESVLTLVQPTLAQFEQSAQAQQGIGSMPEAQQMMQGAGDMGQMMPSGDQQLAQDQQQVDMAQMTGQPVEAQEGLFTGVGGRTFYVNPTGGITTALPLQLPQTFFVDEAGSVSQKLPNRLPYVIPQGNIPAIRPIAAPPSLTPNLGTSYNLGTGIAGTPAASAYNPNRVPATIPAGGGAGNVPPSSPGFFSKLKGTIGSGFGKVKPFLRLRAITPIGALTYGASEAVDYVQDLTPEERKAYGEMQDVIGMSGEAAYTSEEDARSRAGYEDTQKKIREARAKAVASGKERYGVTKEELDKVKKDDATVPPPEKKFKARSIDEILNSDQFKKTQKAYEKLYGYDADFLKGQAYQQLAQFGLNLAAAKGGNTVQKIAESAKSPLATFAAIGAEAQKAKREGRLEAGKGAIKEAEFEKKLEQYAEFGITPKEAILGAKTGDLKDLENARTAITTGYEELLKRLPKEQKSIVTENAAAIYKQEPTTAGLKKAENYIVSIINRGA